MASHNGPITHIVLFKYAADLSWTEFESHFRDFQALSTSSLHPVTGKPLIQSIKMGKNRSWESYSKGMTHGFVLDFENQSDLDYYLTKEPTHLQFSKAAKPLIEDSVVIDIIDGQLFGQPAPVPDEVSSQDRNLYGGRCHCGQITWTARLHTAEHVLCHCDTCKALGGGPYSCNQIIPQDDLQITKGQGGVRCYTYRGASGKDVRCFFCGNCTSHIYHHQDAMPDKYIVRTLLLEGGDKMKAGGEIFAEGRLTWVRELQEGLVNGKLEGCSTRRKVRTDSQLPRGLPELAFIFSVRALIFARRGQAGGVYKCTDTLWRGQCWWTLPNNWGCMDLQSSRGGNVRLSAIGPDAGGF
ncbi:hypothetical protein LTS18_006377, partial [Coniosporium uncinatum]